MLSTRTSAAVVAALAALLTLLAGVTSVVDVAYESASVHVAVETAAALVSLLAGQLILGRYARSTELADLILGASLILLAFGNLAFSALPAIIEQERAALATWGAVIVRTASAALLTAAAWVPPRPLRQPARATRLAVIGGGALLAVTFIAVALVGGAPSDAPARDSLPAALEGNTIVFVLQLAATVLYAAAAIGFVRRADRGDDSLIRWLGIACVFGAFSRLNYLIDPSLGTTWLLTGDVLRLAFFASLLVAGVHELRWAQRRVADAAVLEERARISREIHDGMAQDLAFLVQQGRGLRRSLGPTPAIERMIDAAQHALDESREAVTALVRPSHQPLSEALAETAREAAEREGSTVDTELLRDVSVPGPTQEAMVRVLREAVINAARHGGARHIRVQLREDPRLCLSVSDDGRGFDVARAAAAPGRPGLKGMAERVKGIGGELSIESAPGHGTRVLLVVE